MNPKRSLCFAVLTAAVAVSIPHSALAQGCVASHGAGVNCAALGHNNVGVQKDDLGANRATMPRTRSPRNLNETKSKLVKVTMDDADATGKPIHTQWTGMFDGKDYPVTGNSDEDTRAYKKINDRTLEFISKKDGKVITKGKVVVAADGKIRTVTSSKKFKNKET